jgi:hypothetical protein
VCGTLSCLLKGSVPGLGDVTTEKVASLHVCFGADATDFCAQVALPATTHRGCMDYNMHAMLAYLQHSVRIQNCMER